MGVQAPMTPYLADPDVTIYQGDVLDTLRGLPDGSVDCCITSPPYWGLRDYGVEGQLGLEATPDEYVARMVEVFGEVRRVLRPDGTCWLNLGDSYAGSRGAQSRPDGNDIASTLQGGSRLSARQIEAHPKGTHTGSLKNTPSLKQKDLVGVPWRVAFALQADGWGLRSDIIWSKPNPMPESVTDRPTKSHEYVFLLTKSARYLYDAGAIREQADWSRWGDQTVGEGSNPNGWIKPRTKEEIEGKYLNPGNRTTNGPRSVDRKHKEHGSAGFDQRLVSVDGRRNARSVWEIATQPYPEAHFATFPEELVRRCILAGCPEGGTVLDPFGGSGTTALVARKHGRRAVLVELNADYCRMAAQRLQQLSLLAEATA